MEDERQRFEGSRAIGEATIDPAVVEPAVRRLRIIAGAMALSVASAFGVLVIMRAMGSPTGDATEQAEPILGILVVVAAVLLVAAPFVERFLLLRGAAADPLQRYQVAKVVSLALREAVGLLGFLVGLLSGQLLWAAGLGGASLLAIALAWPRVTDLTLRPADPLPPTPGPLDPR